MTIIKKFIPVYLGQKSRYEPFRRTVQLNRLQRGIRQILVYINVQPNRADT